MITITKELLQERIDHYNAASQAGHKLVRTEMAWYFSGKADAYINLINELYPELEGERAFPLDKKKRQEKIESIIKLHRK